MALADDVPTRIGLPEEPTDVLVVALVPNSIFVSVELAFICSLFSSEIFNSRAAWVVEAILEEVLVDFGSSSIAFFTPENWCLSWVKKLEKGAALVVLAKAATCDPPANRDGNDNDHTPPITSVNATAIPNAYWSRTCFGFERSVSRNLYIIVLCSSPTSHRYGDFL